MNGKSLLIKLHSLGLRSNRIQKYGAIRTFLSDSYRCEEEWKARFDNPLLQKFKNENLYGDLLKKFQNEGKASPIDVDIFTNLVDGELQLNSLEDITNRFRRCPNTVHSLPSTGHAIIRAYLTYKDTETLMRLLDDRLNYGVFPDYYLSNLLMDTFLKQENYRDAVKVAIQMMLQEDFNHPIASNLALYSCYSYLKNPKPETWDPQPKPIPEEPKEVVKVRVDYIREPFFDDHFDLTDPHHLIGKTLVALSKVFAGKCDSISQSSLLLGWTLFQKYERIIETLDTILGSPAKPLIHKECLTHCQEIIGKLTDLPDGFLELFNNRLSKLESEGFVNEGDFLESIKIRVEESVKLNEAADIQKQIECYKMWHQIREDEVEKKIKEIEYHRRLEILETTKKELEEKEERLNFFDNLDNWELRVEQKEEERQLHAAKMIGTGKKLSSKMLRQAEEDSYIPPEIVKQYKSK